MTYSLPRQSLGFVTGLAAFFAVHAVEAAMWSAWFGGLHVPWFLNSGRAIVFAASCLFGIAAVAGAVSLPALATAAGAITAMVLILIRIGGSTIFPIVIVGGGLVVGVSILAGARTGAQLGGLVRRRRRLG
ncbi:MAG TPA: hypothetical protein VH583_06790 [Vicinamibacterales bacterium]|jgi:hypothetical protein